MLEQPRISYFGCSKHHVQFSFMLQVTIILFCFTRVVPFLCMLPGTVILAVMLKSAILMPKNWICPILPVNKNYLRNYLDPIYYLKVAEWQDDSWSGNCYSSINEYR